LLINEEKPVIVSSKNVDVKTENPERIEMPAEMLKPEQAKTERTEKIESRQAVSEDVKTGEIESVKTVVVNNEKSKRVKAGSAKNVPKTVEKRSTVDRIYKPVATTKRPRTSTSTKMHAEIIRVGMRKVERPANTSNNDFARVVRPFSLLSASVKLLKMKSEGMIKTVEIKVPETKQEEKSDSYHILNKARHRLLYPKIASGAADSLN